MTKYQCDLFGNYGLPSSELDPAIGFDTDFSLRVTWAWDNVTGWGRPNGSLLFKESQLIRRERLGIEMGFETDE